MGVGGGGGLDRIAKDGGTTTDDMACCDGPEVVGSID
jgi:hypothetical protein